MTIIISIYCSSQTLPSFSFTNLKIEKITSSGLPDDKPIVVFYIDPNCGQCQKQAVRFKEKAAKLTNITIVFVARAEIEEIEKFRKEYFSSMPNTIFSIL